MQKTRKKTQVKKEDTIIGKRWIYAWIIISIIIIDQFVKYIVIKHLINKIAIIPKILELEFVINTGGAFGIFNNYTMIISVISSIIILTALFYSRTILENDYFYMPIGLIIGGAISNLIDRIMYGFVIDFISISIWPVFNLADTAITMGVLWISYNYYRKKEFMLN